MVGDSNYRRKTFDEYGKECSNCGSTSSLEVHHLDGDRTNNSVENLLPLCRVCHRKLHRSGLGGLEDELKPVEMRGHIDQSKLAFQFTLQTQLWEEWKDTVPRSKALDERIRELIEADKDGRVSPTEDSE